LRTGLRANRINKINIWKHFSHIQTQQSAQL